MYEHTKQSLIRSDLAKHLHFCRALAAAGISPDRFEHDDGADTEMIAAFDDVTAVKEQLVTVAVAPRKILALAAVRGDSRGDR
jgi:hypothetical protein